jgi:hypothetical protein
VETRHLTQEKLAQIQKLLANPREDKPRKDKYGND